MESGIVKWFDVSKGRGLVSRQDGEEVAVEVSPIALNPGDVVQFKMIKGPNGLLATNITRLPSGWTGTVNVGFGSSEIGSGYTLLSGIRKRLGIRLPLKSDADLVAIVEKRLPVSSISSLIESGILEKEIYSLVVPRRTLEHRRARKERLSREESDRAVRIAMVTALAEKIFGNRSSGMQWLRNGKKRFRGRAPIDMIATSAGSRLIEEALYQIDEGMAA